MAACSLSRVLKVKLSNFYLEINENKCTRLEALREIKCCRLETSYQNWGFIRKPVHFGGCLMKHTWRTANPLVIRCGSSSQSYQPGDDSKENEKISIKEASQGIPNSSEVQSLLTSICDTTNVAEFKLNLGRFRLYVKRDLNGISISPPSPILPTTQVDMPNQVPDTNGSATTASLAISKPEPSLGGIKKFLDTASDEGLVILQSPKVGFFRRSRTIKGKRAPPSCKEKQEVKDGQVLCYIEQLGGEIPIESDVSGEVIKILRDDGEPVGYGDALITILPSFPGIKKLM